MVGSLFFAAKNAQEKAYHGRWPHMHCHSMATRERNNVFKLE